MIIGVRKNYFRTILQKNGLRDELLVDDGLEFNLIFFFQDMLREFRYNKTRQPWIRTKSTDMSSICLVLVRWALALTF